MDQLIIFTGSAGKESACKAGDLGLIPGLGRPPGEGKRLPTPAFWPGEFRGLYSPWGLKELDTTERLSLTHSLVAYSGFPDSSVGTESTCNAGDPVQFLGQGYPQEKG